MSSEPLPIHSHGPRFKPCRQCRIVKPWEEFPRDTSKGLRYRRPTCKECCAPPTKEQMRGEHDRTR
jgi:hypothetical protein